MVARSARTAHDGGGIVVDVVDDADGLHRLEEDWRRLEAGDPRAEPGTDVDLVRAWWETHRSRPGTTLSVLVARHSGAVVGILPLALRRGRVQGRDRSTLRWAGDGPWMGAVVEPGASRTVLDTLLAHLDGDTRWDHLDLDHVRPGSRLGSAVLRSEAWGPSLRPRAEHPVVRLGGLADLEAFERDRGLPPRTRRHRRTLLRRHGVRFVVHDGPDDDLLHALEVLHARSGGGPAPRTLLRSRRAMAARVRTYGYASRDGDLVAARTVLRHGPDLITWAAAGDPAWAEHRPEACLLHDLLDHVLTEGSTRTVDLGPVRAAWTFEWTEDFVTSYALRTERAPVWHELEDFVPDRCAADPLPDLRLERGEPGDRDAGPRARPSAGRAVRRALRGAR